MTFFVQTIYMTQHDSLELDNADTASHLLISLSFIVPGLLQNMEG